MRLVLLGDPVAHSRSPAIHQAALDHLRIAGTYEARQVDRSGLESVIDRIRSGEIDGANVTMPHKAAAAALADDLSPAAARADAVNTLVKRGSRLVGSLTDVDGVGTAWAWAGLPTTGPVLVLGSGGAAAAALLALEGRDLYLSARRPGAAASLASSVAVSAIAVPWGTGVGGAVVVNCTPLGMEGETLPHPVLDSATGLFDMAYGTRPTPCVEAMRAADAPVADGLDMLLGQAVASFTIWTGRPAPEAVMRAALTT